MQRRRMGDGAAARRFLCRGAAVILFEFEFYGGGIKRAWGADVYEALNGLGFYDPRRALASGAVVTWRKVSEVAA